ncbi:hypothetical protein OQH60_06205 [Campylobacter sp. MIT 21-1685]|uniref:hypothetical protein n=1 Tax=unclassified Campylobacter TaxID=2593542 RepID=UPI00224AF513|nr:MULTISPECIES: hypothetical protein [unclassified Campylobacter]MCX2683441.1 hypothetical protein [Campylobacter sp. MIT 21-1684]MCX2751737.1 hypothetical protein [Campylobacter sp. MIT 21-1682]MCX2807939.1 hypothetical protein [Campylobacter sp. MIT 21-1685]
MSKAKSAQNKNSLEKKLILKEILESKMQNFESLFNSLELSSFSHSIILQEYQIAALKVPLQLKIFTHKV